MGVVVVIGVVKCALIRSYGYPIADSGVIAKDYSNGCIQEITTFQAISSTEVHAEVHKGGEIGAQTGIFIRSGKIDLSILQLRCV